MIMSEKKFHPVDVCVGKQLRKRRLELEMSQEELANTVDLTFQQIQKYEKGFNRISSSMLYELAKVLRVEISYFFDSVDYVSDSNNQANDEASRKKLIIEQKVKAKDRELNDLLNSYQSITDKKLKSQILTLVKTFAQQ